MLDAGIRMNEEFRQRRARIVREIANHADPFTKKRLLDLAARYERAPRPATPVPTAPIDAKPHTASAATIQPSAP